MASRWNFRSLIWPWRSVSWTQPSTVEGHEPTHHVLAGSPDVGTYHHELSWAETQARTSSDWRPTAWLTRFVEFHYGYFNHHIEHPLFPTRNPSLL